MASLQAKQAWAVVYDPSGLIEMSEHYNAEALQTLNEHLAKGDYVVLSEDAQGYPGDLVIDFPAGAEMPYRVLINLT
jgi:hypothetical protein